MKQTLVAVVTLQYFCGSGHTISNGTKEYSNDDYLHFSKKIIRLQKARNIVKYYKFLFVAMEMLVTMTIS